MYKIIFFGLGSIGQRHAQLLQKYFKHSLFAFRSNKKGKPNRMGIKEIYTWKEVKKLSADVAFITNPTFLHLKTAIKCAQLGINLFIEKPIDCKTDRLDELIGIVDEKGLTAYVAYCLRFHPIIKQIYRHLINKNSLHCKIIASSYLPEWRSNRDYRSIYSANKNMGGGVILDLSHEIDYIQYLLGGIMKMQGAYGRISELEVSSEDYADIIIQCKRGIANLHLNFFSKNQERSILIDFKSSGYMKADLIRNTLSINRNGKKQTYRFDLTRDDIYLEQLKFFFKNSKNRRMMNNLADASKLFRKIIAFKSDNQFGKLAPMTRGADYGE